MKAEKALLEAQKRLSSVKFDSTNPMFRSKYVSLDAIWSKIRPVLNECGVIVTQYSLGITEKLDSGFSVSVTTKVRVVSDDDVAEVDCITTTVPVMDQVKTSGGTTTVKYPDAQSVGAAITYAKRYALVAYFGLVGTDRDDDDDANSIATTHVEVKPHQEVAKAMQAANSKEECIAIFNSHKASMSAESKRALGELGKELCQERGWQ